VAPASPAVQTFSLICSRGAVFCPRGCCDIAVPGADAPFSKIDSDFRERHESWIKDLEASGSALRAKDRDGSWENGNAAVSDFGGHAIVGGDQRLPDCAFKPNPLLEVEALLRPAV
jgi:hypothetical protein